jgi:hypothetical protein
MKELKFEIEYDNLFTTIVAVGFNYRDFNIINNHFLGPFFSKPDCLIKWQINIFKDKHIKRYKMIQDSK